MTPRDLAEDLMARGAAVLPLRQDKAPVTHLVPNGFRDASSDRANLWWFEHEDTELVGFVPASLDLIVLDVDVKGAVDGRKTLERLVAEEPQGWIYSTIVRTRSGGFHLYLRKPEPSEHIGNHDLCAGVNVRSDAGYVVAPGNPGYRFERGDWESGAVVAPDWVMKRLSIAAEAEAEVRLDDPYDVPEARMEPIEEWHPKVLQAFKSFSQDGDRHTSMTSAVAALCSCELLGYSGATRALFILEENFIRAIQDRSDPWSARREYRRALDGGRRRIRNTASVGLEERGKDRTFIEQIILDAGGSMEDVENVLAIEQKPSLLRLFSMRELMASDLTLNWLVRSVLVTPTYGQIAGERKTLKTYVAQYLALAVATGRPFLNQFPVEKQGNVVMFVGEGGKIPWTRRMPRIAESVGITDVRDAPIHAVFQTAPLLSPAFKQTVEKVLTELDPVLTIIDPYYAYHGGDTNSANLHEEGALLTAAAAPFIEHGSNLLIANHFNKAAGGGLGRITQSGSGEWVDSWILTATREPADLNGGNFYIAVEFGSRQWGGSRWEIDFNIGSQNAMGEEADTPIRFELRRGYS